MVNISQAMQETFTSMFNTMKNCCNNQNQEEVIQESIQCMKKTSENTEKTIVEMAKNMNSSTQAALESMNKNMKNTKKKTA